MSLGFAKKDFIKNPNFFKKIYNYMIYRRFDYYQTKDEIFNKFKGKIIISKKVKKYLNNNLTNLYSELYIKNGRS